MENKEKKQIHLREIGLPKIILMAAAGILLIVLSIPQKQTAEKEAEEEKVETMGNDAYVMTMEKKLEENLRKIDGVGRVEAMLTLESSREAVLNKDEQLEQEKTGDDVKNSNMTRKSEETVLTEKNGEQIPYIIKEMEPKVAGVVVILEGGGNPVIVKEVTEAIQVLFHLEVNKIKVLKMEGAK